MKSYSLGCSLKEKRQHKICCEQDVFSYPWRKNLYKTLFFPQVYFKIYIFFILLGVVPINSRGEKQRMHLRDGFLADQLDPIYVAYNM